MGRLHCKRCSKEVHPGRGDYYLVRIEAVADPQPSVITQEDLDQDVGAEIERLIRLILLCQLGRYPLWHAHEFTQQQLLGRFEPEPVADLAMYLRQ